MDRAVCPIERGLAPVGKCHVLTPPNDFAAVSSTLTESSSGFSAGNAAQSRNFRILYVNARPQARCSTLTKKPSVPVVRGVIRMPSADSRAALPNIAARSPSALITSVGLTTENSG